MGFEPTTPTMARLCSTPELRPHHVQDAGFNALSKTLQAGDGPVPWFSFWQSSFKWRLVAAITRIRAVWDQLDIRDFGE